jgi:hypothetical protein
VPIDLWAPEDATNGSQSFQLLRLLRVVSLLRLERQSKSFRRLRTVVLMKRTELVSYHHSSHSLLLPIHQPMNGSMDQLLL